MRAWLTRYRNSPSPLCIVCYHAKFDRFRINGTSVRTEVRLSRSVEVTRADTERSATSDLLLVIIGIAWAYLVPFPR